MLRPTIPWKTFALAVPRGLALFLGLFALLNLVGEFLVAGFDANLWWINLPGEWQFLDTLLLGWSASCLLWFAAHQRLSLTQRYILTGTFGLLVAASLWNAVTFYGLVFSGGINTLFPIPFAVFVACCLLVVTAGVWRPTLPAEKPSLRLYYGAIAATIVACGGLFPTLQMMCFGMTDYRRPADVIVVFGAKVFADGRLSSALEERVLTGCELYRTGLAPHIVFSGGPGVGEIHETAAMRQRALELGVPSEAITLDSDGWDTDSTAENVVELIRRRKWKRVLAVSQFFHLPRIKLAFHRHGSEVYTVPSVRRYQLRYLPYFMLREVAAWWVYYVRPLWSAGMS
ncbi:MAG: YdcF family protein [Planctomycetota bacterium]